MRMLRSNLVASQNPAVHCNAISAVAQSPAMTCSSTLYREPKQRITALALQVDMHNLYGI